MNAELLLAHFNRISEAPDGVPRLRRFVLDLAIRGKLVEQDPNDEPASELLRKIQAEKARLVKEGKINREEPHTPASPGDLAFELKPKWLPASIRQILVELQTGPFGSSLHQSDYQKGGIPVINPASIKDGRLIPLDNMAVGPATLEKLRTFKLRAGDIVMARRGEMGRCALVTERENGWLCGTGSLILRLPKCVFARFFVILIGSPFAREYLGGSAVGATMQNLNQSILLNLVVGLPPSAEQKRIVTAVDELMALCDRLEAVRAEREDRRDRLTAACVHHLDNGANAEAVREHAHFYVNHLPALTVRREQINQLRQTIRNLAIRGQLGPQDPKDEPASELLQRIVADKARLLREGKMNKQKPVPPVGGSVMPFDLPTGWIWTRLGELSSLVTSGSRDWAKHYSKNGAIFVRMGNLSRDSYQLRLAHIQRVTPPTDTEGARTKLEEGDILISITGEVGLLGLIPQKFGDAYINQHTCLVRPMERLRDRFLPELFCSPFAQHQFDEPQRGLKNSFRLTDVTNFLVPLPPLAEQHRIVAKLDELMGICDRLEAQLINAQTESSLLLESVLHDALQSGDHVPEPQRLNATA